MKYASKMIIDRKTGKVRRIAEGRVPDGTESHRKYLSPGYTELLQVFSQKENAKEALDLATKVECLRLESHETRLAELRKALARLDRIQVPQTVLARMINMPRSSLVAYAGGRSQVPPRILLKVRIAVDRLEKLNDYLRDILPA